MPILTPALNPPGFEPEAQQKPIDVVGTIDQLDSASLSPILTPQKSQSSSAELPKSKIPSITLLSDVITDSMAARLGASLLGHVLFLKNQVPFPVVQLARMPGGQSNTRAAKKRAELLTSFDTLTSHLQTTFTALSTALAKNAKIKSLSVSRRFDDAEKSPKKLARAYLAFVLGPSASSAKFKVIFAVDGLEVKIWGSREDEDGEGNGKVAEESDVSSREDEEEEEEGSDNDRDVDDSVEESESGSNNECDSTLEDLEDTSSGSSDSDSIIDEQPSSPPPQSRSPSPDSSSSSRSQSPLSDAPTPRPVTVSRPPPLPQTPSYASEQDALRSAEFLLSRTLANASAEDDGLQMACELAPTQTHIFLRAPRRFIHSAWTPRQQLNGAMDTALGDFFEDSGMGTEAPSERKKKRKKGERSEGVWIRCQNTAPVTGVKDEADDVATDEEDEMIWWTWDGKLVGFSDW